MSSRPADLPDFESPPVTEVVLGVQFNSVERFLAPHFGLVWERFKSKFPHLEEHPPLPPTFETFGPRPQFLTTIGLQFSAMPEMPRVFFINEDRTELLQLQKDRFLHNWRKVGQGTDYPRFERMLETFVGGFEEFIQATTNAGLGNVIPNQCEVSYINQIPVQESGGVFDLVNELFPQQAAYAKLSDLGSPEDLRFILRYVLRDKDGAPAGRLLVSAEPARRADGQTILQLNLTARGKPPSADIAGVIAFLERGREDLVRAFTQLTNERMHRVWGRKQ